MHQVRIVAAQEALVEPAQPLNFAQRRAFEQQLFDRAPHVILRIADSTALLHERDGTRFPRNSVRQSGLLGGETSSHAVPTPASAAALGICVDPLYCFTST